MPSVCRCQDATFQYYLDFQEGGKTVSTAPSNHTNRDTASAGAEFAATIVELSSGPMAQETHVYPWASLGPMPPRWRLDISDISHGVSDFTWPARERVSQPEFRCDFCTVSRASQKKQYSPSRVSFASSKYWRSSLSTTRVRALESQLMGQAVQNSALCMV